MWESSSESDDMAANWRCKRARVWEVFQDMYSCTTVCWWVRPPKRTLACWTTQGVSYFSDRRLGLLLVSCKEDLVRVNPCLLDRRSSTPPAFSLPPLHHSVHPSPIGLVPPQFFSSPRSPFPARLSSPRRISTAFLSRANNSSRAVAGQQLVGSRAVAGQ